MSGSQEEDPPSYDEAMLNSPPVSMTSSPPVFMTSPPASVTSPPVSMTSSPPVFMTSPPASVTSPPASVTSPPVSMTSPPIEQPASGEVTNTAAPENATEEEKKEKKAQEAGWRGDLLLPGVPGSSGVTPQTVGLPAAIPVNGSQVGDQGATASGITAEVPSLEERNRLKAEEAGWKVDGPGAAASGASAGVPSLEERNRLKAEEAGWKGDVFSSGAGPSSAPPMLPTSGPMVLPPGLQPLINLDVLRLRGTYERGKGRRYKIMSKTGEAVLYARSVRRGHHHPKDFQLYDSTRTAVVGQLTFSQAADNSLYGNLECPSKVSLATIRAEDYVEQRQGEEATADQMSTARNGVKYTICNVLGQPVFIIPSPPITNARGVQIKVYSAITPGVQVSEITWDVDDAMEAVDESQSTIGDRGDDPLSERKIKIIFPLDLEVKMKAAIVAMCLVKDKIDHRMEKGSAVFGAYRAPSVDALPIPIGRKGRHRHHRF